MCQRRYGQISIAKIFLKLFLLTRKEKGGWGAVNMEKLSDLTKRVVVSSIAIACVIILIALVLNPFFSWIVVALTPRLQPLAYGSMPILPKQKIYTPL